MVATILRMAPEIFENQQNDKKFRCSDSFLRKWLHRSMNWSQRQATRASHKLPPDWEAQCRNSFLRLAYKIKDNDIPSELFVNSDQTNMILVQGTNLTWAKTGSKQVSVVGTEEKRAVTVVVGVSNSGELLPFQAVYQGYTNRSCPKTNAEHYQDLTASGCQLDYSESDTYWSTQRTMRLYVENILVPYFSRQKEKIGLPEEQKAIWQIDVWSVHRSVAFRTWLKKKHPNIILEFVPAGCTPVFQACDVGIQRILKHSWKRSCHQDIVGEILEQIDNKSEMITIENKLGVLRDRTVKWLWDAYNTVNQKEIIEKVRIRILEP
jgi:hypothetical protein